MMGAGVPIVENKRMEGEVGKKIFISMKMPMLEIIEKKNVKVNVGSKGVELIPMKRGRCFVKLRYHLATEIKEGPLYSQLNIEIDVKNEK